MIGEILSHALPYAHAVMKFLELASRERQGNLTKEEIAQEIAEINQWAQRAKLSDLDLFARARGQSDGET